MFMPAPSISTVTTTARNIPTLTIYEDFDKIIAKEVCFTETGNDLRYYEISSLHSKWAHLKFGKSFKNNW